MSLEIDRNTRVIPDKDKLSQAEIDGLQDSVSKVLNPNGDNTKMAGYISSTFGYISWMLDKVAKAEDRDKAAEEIAQDLKQKFETWASKQKGTDGDTGEEDATETEKDELKKS